MIATIVVGDESAVRYGAERAAAAPLEIVAVTTVNASQSPARRNVTTKRYDDIIDRAIERRAPEIDVRLAKAHALSLCVPEMS